MIRRYLLARSAEQFSRVKIGALHSGKGYRGIKEEQEEEEEEEEKKRKSKNKKIKIKRVAWKRTNTTWNCQKPGVAN